MGNVIMGNKKEIKQLFKEEVELTMKIAERLNINYNRDYFEMLLNKYMEDNDCYNSEYYKELYIAEKNLLKKCFYVISKKYKIRLN